MLQLEFSSRNMEPVGAVASVEGFGGLLVFFYSLFLSSFLDLRAATAPFVETFLLYL